MAASLRFAARKICGPALGRPPQPYFKEGQSLLLPRINHGGSFPRRFSSSKSSPLNKQHGPQSTTNTAGSSKHTPWFVLSHPNYVRNIFFETIGTAIGGLAILYVVARTEGGPIFREKLLGLPPKASKEYD
uniref:Uncharacterized protein n=1 Tax=Aegilops tauschii subsp. strangulata TaxID=200361 RepID=A0A453F8S6_AEGTS